MVLPLLLVLLFGVIEASWAFAQVNDVRHGAREGARAAAVDVGNVAAIGQLVCDRMDLIQSAENIRITLTKDPDGEGQTGEVGDTGAITVIAELKTLTGLFDPFFGGKTLTSSVEFRLEQPATGDVASWWGEATSVAPPFDPLNLPAETYTCS